MRKKPAKAGLFPRISLAAGALLLSFTGVGPHAALAIGTPPTPSPAPFSAAGGAATALPANARELPIDSSLFVVLDEAVTSRGRSGQAIRAHLRDAIVLDGVRVAPAGTPVQVVVVDVRRAQMGNVDGWVQIDVKPLALPDGLQLPLHLPRSHIDRFISAGEASTQNIKDTVGDIFVPYHYLYHVLRKGSDVTLAAGTVIRTRTSATIALTGRAVVMTTPPPLPTSIDTPHPQFSAAPLYTPRGFVPPTPKPSPKPSATP